MKILQTNGTTHWRSHGWLDGAHVGVSQNGHCDLTLLVNVECLGHWWLVGRHWSLALLLFAFLGTWGQGSQGLWKLRVCRVLHVLGVVDPESKISWKLEKCHRYKSRMLSMNKRRTLKSDEHGLLSLCWMTIGCILDKHRHKVFKIFLESTPGGILSVFHQIKESSYNCSSQTWWGCNSLQINHVCLDYLRECFLHLCP